MRIGPGLPLTLPRRPAWTPAALSPALWLTAGPRWCQSGQGVRAGDGDTLYGWTDRAGGDGLVQAVSTMRPTLSQSAGLWGVGFDGGDLMAGVNNLALGSGDFSLWAVLTAHDPADNYKAVLTFGNASPGFFLYQGDAVLFGGATSTFTLGLADGELVAVGVGRRSGSIRCWKNGAIQAGSFADATDFAAAAPVVGWRADQTATQGFGRTIHEVVALGGSTSDDDVSALADYFRARWGTP